MTYFIASFWCAIYPFEIGEIKTSLNGRKVKARSMYKACNLRMQTMTLKGTTWEMTCLTFAWFSHKASVSYSICSNLPLHQVIFKCYFKNPWIHREHVNMQLVHMYSTDWVFVRHFGDALLYKDIKNLLHLVIHLVMRTVQNWIPDHENPCSDALSLSIRKFYL